MIFDAALEQLVQQVSQLYGQELEAARDGYFRMAGQPFLEEPSYEGRLQNFVEWYVFDRPLAGGQTPYAKFMAEAKLSEEESIHFEPFGAQIHSLFQVLRLTDNGMALKDLWTLETYRVALEITAGYEPRGVAELRLVPWEGGYGLANTNVYHMKACARLVRKRAKVLRKTKAADEWRPFMHHASSLQLKTQRYRHVDAKKIYLELLETPATEGRLKV